jgi:hypothetical protein
MEGDWGRAVVRVRALRRAMEGIRGKYMMKSWEDWLGWLCWAEVRWC